MREIVLDTETTGTSTEDRIVEIGCVELQDRMPTGKTFHVYINPTIEVPKEAVKIHGLTYDFLKTKPVFKRIVNKFLAFIGEAPLVAHNASFDVRMINAELARLDLPPLSNEIIDTLVLARQARPGRKNSLDALIKEYGIRTERELHGALLDSQILADIYVELLGGRQHMMELVAVDTKKEYEKPDYGPRTFISRITPEEQIDHTFFVASLGKDSIWAEYLGRKPVEMDVWATKPKEEAA